MVSPSLIGMASSEESAPEIVTLKDYRLKFGINKDLEITEGVKVVEAHSHQSKKTACITLIYQNLGSFTFALSPSVPLTESSEWLV